MLHAHRNAHNGEYERIECPTCHAIGQFKNHGSYRRWLATLDGGSRQETLVTIDRLRCRSCHAVHSLVPYELSTRSPNSNLLCKAVAKSHEDGTLTVADICAMYGISTRTLYRILKKSRELNG